MRQVSIARHNTVMPRGIAGRVFAMAGPVTIEQVNAAVLDFKANHLGRVEAIEAALDKQEARMAGAMLNGGGLTTLPPAEPEYTAAFAGYVRNGGPEVTASLREANSRGDRAAIQAAMSEGDSSSGGYLAPVEWDRKIHVAQRTISPMRRISQVVTTGRSAWSSLWSDDLWGTGWVGETASRPATATGTLSPLVIPAGEIFANPAATQRLLDDAAVDIDQWLSQGFSNEFTRQEGIAFVAGNGVNKPMGFLQYTVGGAAETGPLAHPGGTLSMTVSGNATGIPNTDVLVDLKYGLAAPYRQNATWLMNSQTAASIAKMKDGDDNYIWRESLLASEPSTLLGRPVEIDENMPNIGAGLYPIAFGDFNAGYLINDRIGIRILRDPYTNKPYVMFYGTKRVGGGVIDPRAIRLLKIAAS